MNTDKPIPEYGELTRPYWEAAQQERLLLPRCETTGQFFMCPSLWSPYAYSGKIGWAQASGRGEVKSYTVVHQAPYAAYAEKTPYVVAVIRLEEQVQLMANIINCDPDDVAVGAKVHVVFETRAGGFKVPQFELSRPA